MSRLAAVWRKEMATQLVSPSLYGMAAVFLAVTGLNFWKLCGDSSGAPTAMSVLLFGPMFFWVITLFLITGLTMRTFAEERRSGTIELMMTAPVRDWDLVGGKYAAALTLLALILLPTAAYPWLLRFASTGAWSVDRMQVLTGWGGVLLVGSFYTAVGVLVSSLARSPVLAAFGIFAALSVLFFLDAFWYIGPSAPVQRVLEYASAVQHVVDFSRGILDSRAFVFHLSGAALALFMAVKAVEAKRWR